MAPERALPPFWTVPSDDREKMIYDIEFFWRHFKMFWILDFAILCDGSVTDFFATM